MPLDTSIAMGYRPMQMPNQLAQYAQMQQILGGQQEQQLNALKMQEAQAAMQERNALSKAYSSSINPETGQIDYNKLTGLVAGAGAGAQLPGIEKTRRELETANLTQQKARSELLDAKLKQSRGFLDTIDPTSPDAAQKYLAWHEANHRDPIVGAALKERGITADQSRQDIQAAIERGPEALAQLITRSKLGTEKFMELNKPTITTQNLGGEVRSISTPGLGLGPATVVPGSVAPMTMTPFQTAELPIKQSQLEISKGQLGVSKGQLAVAQGQLKVAQDKLAKEGANLDPSENAAISKAIIEGRLDPNKVNGRNAKILATTLLANPEANVLELGVSAAGANAAERSLATQTAKMSTAANEANKMVDIVRDLSDKVNRTEYPSINAISNAVSKGTGGKEIVQLNTSINALVNSYARAISPTGQPTVSDKNHAREIINSAYSKGQIGAILDVMQQEMSIAREAAGTASTELKASREAARGRPKSATATLEPADKQALDWANSNPKDPRALQIKQRLGQ